MANCRLYFVFSGLSDPGEYINSNGKDNKCKQMFWGKKLRGWEVDRTGQDHVLHRNSVLDQIKLKLLLPDSYIFLEERVVAIPHEPMHVLTFIHTTSIKFSPYFLSFQLKNTTLALFLNVLVF